MIVAQSPITDKKNALPAGHTERISAVCYLTVRVISMKKCLRTGKRLLQNVGKRIETRKLTENEENTIHLRSPRLISRMCHPASATCYFQERIQREPLREDIPASGFDV